MLREPLVHERVVGRHQIENVPVLADNASKEQLRLAPERVAQVVVEIRKLVGVGIDAGVSTRRAGRVWNESDLRVSGKSVAW